MKKFIFLILFIQLFGFEINKSKIFTIEYIPKNFVTNITIIMSSENISPLLNKISSFPKQNNCILNNYSISPKFNKNSSFTNYTAYISIKCQLNNNTSKSFDNYLKKLSKIGKIKINSISPKLQNNTNLLKIKAYTYGTHLTNYLSKHLNKKCFLKSINFNNYSNNYKSTYKSFAMPRPQQTYKNRLKAYYTIECLD